MSKNNKLTTVSKGEANYINQQNKNLFWDGGYYDNLQPATNQQSSWKPSIVSSSVYHPTEQGTWQAPSGDAFLYNGPTSVQGDNLSGYNPQIPNNISINPNKAQQDANALTYNSDKNSKNLMGKAAQGFGMISGIVGAALGGIGAGFDQVEQVQQKKDQYMSQAKNLTNQMIDNSSVNNLSASINNLSGMDYINKSKLLSSKGQFAKDFLAHPLGAGIGRIIGHNKAKKGMQAINTQIAESNALNQNRVQNAADNLYNNIASASKANVTAFGGPIDTFDITSPLGYGLAKDWMGIQQTKAHKDRMSQLNVNTNTLGNDTLFKQFASGGKLKEGEEVELTEEQIKELEKLGYKFEY